jgi:hypothetical protein
MLPMQADPILEWQRLSEHYRAMNDDELRQLATDFADLTDAAQQALRSEFQNLGFGDPESANTVPVASNAPPAMNASFTAPLPLRNAPSDPVDDIAFGAAFGPRAELVPDTPYASAEVDGPIEYTWKTPLCECNTLQEANKLSAALKQAGIDNWIEGPKPSAYSAYASLDLMNPRVLVAADQLDQARALAANPIPSEIVAESQAELPDFTPPSCPNCGAPDPILEGVDPVNSWKCEQCGQKWADSVPAESTNAGSSPAQPA